MPSLILKDMSDLGVREDKLSVIENNIVLMCADHGGCDNR